jgi:CelD/BcsL family acetyltransferase involved in cellulose biosynthesis
VLVLPESLDDYQKAIGKTTRLQIHKGINRLEKQFQDFRFRLFEKSEAEEDTLNRIIDLNHERMQMRRKASGIDSAYRNRIIDFSRKYGFVGVSSIGDRIISGSIGYKLNDTIYLAVISHDSEYDYYSPGHMTIYMTLAEAIRQKAKKVHMFWGKADYKLRFGCVPEEYVCLRIFRNRPRFLVHAGWNAVRTRSLDGLRALKRMLSLRAQWRRELPRSWRCPFRTPK